MNQIQITPGVNIFPKIFIFSPRLWKLFLKFSKSFPQNKISFLDKLFIQNVVVIQNLACPLSRHEWILWNTCFKILFLNPRFLKILPLDIWSKWKNNYPCYTANRNTVSPKDDSDECTENILDLNSDSIVEDFEEPESCDEQNKVSGNKNEKLENSKKKTIFVNPKDYLQDEPKENKNLASPNDDSDESTENILDLNSDSIVEEFEKPEGCDDQIEVSGNKNEELEKKIAFLETKVKEQQNKLSYARKLCYQNGVKINGTCKVFVIKKNEKVTEADLKKLLTQNYDVHRNFVSHSENDKSPSLFKKLMGEGKFEYYK